MGIARKARIGVCNPLVCDLVTLCSGRETVLVDLFNKDFNGVFPLEGLATSALVLGGGGV